jgi:hypothetical protein
MSKGYGAVQRRILVQLGQHPDEWVSLIELTDGPGHSQYESTRRAVISLVNAGVLDVKELEGEVPQWGIAGWRARRMLIHVRLSGPGR